MALLNKQMLPLVILNKNIFLLSKHGIGQLDLTIKDLT